MGARIGGGAGLGSGAGGAGKASRELMSALQSGKFEKMSAAAQERLLEAADKEATRLSENRNIYSDAEWDALKAYEGSHYDRINAAASGTAVSTVSQSTKDAVKNLDSALKRRKLTKDIIVWRGSDRAESTSGRFLSTTTKASIADKFRVGKNMHAYRIPKGTNYIFTQGKNESEVILPRNFNLSKYKIK